MAVAERQALPLIHFQVHHPLKQQCFDIQITYGRAV